MVHAVDSLIAVMRGLSSTEPVMFQRDQRFYVVSEEGFGLMNIGMWAWPLSDREKQDFDKYGGDPDEGNEYLKEYKKQWRDNNRHISELLESEDIIQAFEKDSPYSRYQTPVFAQSELPYIRPLMFGHNDNTFTLDGITGIARLELPDDGMIRMIEHSEGYHSHKHGYAMDGIDVNVQAARKMDREKYLELMRKKEDWIYEKLSRNDIRAKFADCTVVTPFMMFTFPRQGHPRQGHHSRNLWDMYYTRFFDDLRIEYTFQPYDKNPFESVVTINSVAITPDKFGHYQGRLAHELDAINSEMENISQFVGMLNELHAKAHPPRVPANESFLTNI